MLGCFILTLITSISFAKPLVIPISGDDKLAAVNDIKDLKLYALGIICLFAYNIIVSLLKYIWGLFTGKSKDTDERLKNLENVVPGMASDIKQALLILAQVKDNQISESQVIRIIREEKEHEARVRGRG